MKKAELKQQRTEEDQKVENDDNYATVAVKIANRFLKRFDLLLDLLHEIKVNLDKGQDK